MGKRMCVLVVGMAISIAGLSAQGTPSQKPDRTILIGCLASTAQKVYTLKDYRSGRTYRIEADAETIGWHVGHELEVHGSVEVRADGLALKADQVIYVAQRCSS